MLNFSFLLFRALLLFFNKNEHHYSKKSQMTEHFSTLQNITEQIINSTLVLHFFSTWENNLKNSLQKSSFVQFKDHSVHNFHEVLKNFSATLTSRKKSAQNRFEDAFQMFRTSFSFLEIIMAKTCCKLKICCHHHNGKIEQSKQIIERLSD